MPDYARDFGPFGEWVWANASSIGAMPRVAVEAAHEIVSKHSNPALLAEEVFFETAKKLKKVLGVLIGVPAEEIIIGNSTSYGLHLWANGLPLKKSDEVLLVKGEFPATILPWLGLRKHGVIVREIQPKGPILHLEDIQAHLTKATKVLCATWVDSFTGYAFDVEAIGQFCHDHNVWFLLNGTQAIGARPLDVTKTPVDGVTSCGYKWLCGPYGTGFCWLHPDLLKQIEYNQAYWITMQGDRDLDDIRNYQIRTDVGAELYDVFAPANLFNNIPWIQSLEYLTTRGIRNIQNHNDTLVAQLLSELDKNYKIYSPTDPHERTAIIVLSHQDVKRNKQLHKLLLDSKIVCSLREGNIRISPHLYNTPQEMSRVLSILNQNA